MLMRVDAAFPAAGTGGASRTTAAAAAAASAMRIFNCVRLEVHPHVELEAAVHADAVGAGLHGIPVAAVGEVVAVQLERHPLAPEARGIPDARVVERVARDRALLLVVHEAAGHAA